MLVREDGQRDLEVELAVRVDTLREAGLQVLDRDGRDRLCAGRVGVIGPVSVVGDTGAARVDQVDLEGARGAVDVGAPEGDVRAVEVRILGLGVGAGVLHPEVAVVGVGVDGDDRGAGTADGEAAAEEEGAACQQRAAERPEAEPEESMVQGSQDVHGNCSHGGARAQSDADGTAHREGRCAGAEGSGQGRSGRSAVGLRCQLLWRPMWVPRSRVKIREDARGLSGSRGRRVPAGRRRQRREGCGRAASAAPPGRRPLRARRRGRREPGPRRRGRGSARRSG